VEWWTSFEKLFGGALSEAEVLSALQKEGVRERRRGGKLPPQRVFLLLLHLALDRDSSIRSVVGSLALGLGFPTSWGNKLPHSTSIAQARDRLGWKPVRRVFRDQRKPAGVVDQWLGRTAVALDGSCLKAPRSMANVAALGEPSTSKRTASYPLLRTVMAVGVHSHWVYEATFAPYRKQHSGQKVGESALATTLLARLPGGSVLVGDRAYSSFRFISAAQGQGLDVVVRALKNGKGFKVRKVSSLADGTDLVRLKTKAGELLLRRVVFSYRTRRVVPKKSKKKKAYERKRKRGKTSWVVLVTTLLDVDRYPAKEIASLYRDRWEAEHVFKEIKAQLGAGKPVFRGQTTQRVLQEAYAPLLIHRCLWANASDVATETSLSALRVSFEMNLKLSRTAARLDRHADRNLFLLLLRLEALPQRRERHYPREVLAQTPKYRVRKQEPEGLAA